jgi:aspartate carbamoyltransferase catalytic subunit
MDNKSIALRAIIQIVIKCNVKILAKERLSVDLSALILKGDVISLLEKYNSLWGNQRIIFGILVYTIIRLQRERALAAEKEIQPQEVHSLKAQTTQSAKSNETSI